MLYAIKDTKYQGNIFNDNSKAFRESLKAEGYTVAWFDEEPTFHCRWLNTQSKDNEIVVDLTLNECKAIKAADLAYQTALFENNLNKDMYFTSSLGFRVNGDRRTRSNIEDLIRFSTVFPVQYKDYDNNFQQVTKDNLETMLQEHITNGLNLYQQKFSYESQINACTTKEEVEAIKIEFEMMDFSK